eukprot:CAMPEP_0196595110 /NCGR_PEP_ID=MMETSP1081-20130531/80207_1 /TAXON_ID=36882 /ORGANISM="Pyramimonas amylifera, Strain CCMP720" /LENGTH=451 /DNA_ID=CAMNT_0041919573 /DNA_START=149 /DNA_END=1501 /DNA_ORIENTATION=-
MADKEPAKTGLGGWVGWGTGIVGSVVSVASKTMGSALGYQELQIVNPEGDENEPAPTGGNEQERQVLWKQVAQYVGSDIMSLLSIPVWLMEPFSTLQKIGEITEYVDCLSRADDTEDPYVRVALVAAFACGCYPGNKRTYKPFNPILGETFELELKDGTQLLVEQVSHHPPVAAGYAESSKYIYELVSSPKTKFYGNSLDVFPYGITRVTLKSSGAVYALVPPVSRANNIILGRTWVDTFGDLLVVNLTGGEYCALHFNKSSWFGTGRHQVAGTVYSADGEAKMAVAGKWHEQLAYMACDDEGAALKDAAPTTLWKAPGAVAGDPYGFTEYAKHLQTLESAPLKGRGLLISDSRNRPDLIALLEGDSAGAGAAKHEVEEKQRAERKQREAKGDKWTPRWFKSVERSTDADLYEDVKEFEEEIQTWKFTGAYAERSKTMSESAPVTEEFNPW